MAVNRVVRAASRVARTPDSRTRSQAKAANKAGTLDGAKVAAVLDTFSKEPLVIGPTTYTPDLHIQETRPMTIIGVTGGKFAAVGRYTLETLGSK